MSKKQITKVDLKLSLDECIKELQITNKRVLYAIRKLYSNENHSISQWIKILEKDFVLR